MIIRAYAESKDGKPELISELLAKKAEEKAARKKKKEIKVIVEEEVDDVVDAMTAAQVKAELREAGIECDSGALRSIMREALKASYRRIDMEAEEVFEKLDEDESGYLDRGEIEQGAGILGARLGYIMGEKVAICIEIDGFCI